MTHYETLGVEKDATPEQIKSSYRSLAQKHHPDKGGDTAKFQEIKKAFETLSDEGRRKRYNETGADDEEHSVRAQAVEAVANLLFSSVDRIDVTQVDLIRYGREQVGEAIAEAGAQKSAIKDKISKREKVLKRLKFIGKGEDIATNVLLKDIEGLKSRKDGFDKQIQVFREMLEVLKEYTYEVDTPAGKGKGLGSLEEQFMRFSQGNHRNW